MKNYKDIFKDKSWLTISNILTIARISLTPFIVLYIYKQEWASAFILIAISGITDLFDGQLARALKQETFLGKLLDPIADKLLLISIFASLAFIDSPSFLIPRWFVYFILFKEIIILLGAFFLINKKAKFKIEPTIWGKTNTVLQLLFICWLFICNFFGWEPAKTYYVLLVALVIFSLIVFIQYLKIGLNYLLNKNNLS
jgi:cardiolipin synthase